MEFGDLRGQRKENEECHLSPRSGETCLRHQIMHAGTRVEKLVFAGADHFPFLRSALANHKKDLHGA